MTKFEKGKIVTGCVTGIEPYGIFVSLEDHYSGLIHISEISSDYVRNIADYATIGERLDMKVLESDEKNHHVKLSIKDIDYKKLKNSKIHETKNGFNTLREKIPEWTKEAIEKINNEIKK